MLVCMRQYLPSWHLVFGIPLAMFQLTAFLKTPRKQPPHLTATSLT